MGHSKVWLIGHQNKIHLFYEVQWSWWNHDVIMTAWSFTVTICIYVQGTNYKVIDIQTIHGFMTFHDGVRSVMTLWWHDKRWFLDDFLMNEMILYNFNFFPQKMTGAWPCNDFDFSTKLLFLKWNICYVSRVNLHCWLYAELSHFSAVKPLVLCSMLSRHKSNVMCLNIRLLL